MLWFNFILGLNFIFLCFKLIIIYYHTPKTKENKNVFSSIESCLLGDKVNEETIRPQAVPSLLRATRSE